MTVVIVASSLVLGGSARSLVKYVNTIFPVVDGIAVISLGPVSASIVAELEPAVKVIELRCGSTAHPVTWIRVIRSLRMLRPTDVIGWSTYANFVALLACRFLSVKQVIVSERDYAPVAFAKGSVGRIRRAVVFGLMKMLYRKADAITANSDLNLRFLEKYIGVGPSYVMWPNTVELRPLNSEAGCDLPVVLNCLAPPRVLAVGRLDRQKGFDVLLSAIAFLNNERRFNVVIVGDGPERPVLERLASTLGIRRLVHFVGAHSDALGFYQWADIVVVPSRHEGFPNVPLEAMAAGTAVVCSDCKSGPRELTLNGDLGVLVPVEDPVSLAEAIVALAEAPDVRERYALRARDHVAARYSAEAVIDAYLRPLSIVL